jgi:hypothetical protein
MQVSIGCFCYIGIAWYILSVKKSNSLMLYFLVLAAITSSCSRDNENVSRWKKQPKNKDEKTELLARFVF